MVLICAGGAGSKCIADYWLQCDERPCAWVRVSTIVDANELQLEHVAMIMQCIQQVLAPHHVDAGCHAALPKSGMSTLSVDLVAQKQALLQGTSVCMVCCTCASQIPVRHRGMCHAVRHAYIVQRRAGCTQGRAEALTVYAVSCMAVASAREAGRSQTALRLSLCTW